MRRVKVASLLDPSVTAMKGKLRRWQLHTICQEALCPNRGECWAEKTVTFLILGDTCTRSCGFCSVKTGKGVPPDPREPQRIAQAVAELGLHYVVITSVDRDDLEDGGASQFGKTALAIHERSPETRIELLIPDFQRKEGALEQVLQSPITCLSHNVETVPRLYGKVRHGGRFNHSLALLERASQVPGLVVKSSVMVGHGESRGELRDLFRELARVRVQVLTIGQYLQPTRAQLPVVRFFSEGEFQELAWEARDCGIPIVFSGSLVRTSYRAWEVVASTEGKKMREMDREDR